ncbi:hypothetical protein A4G19_10590 [Pasteurellaceae bacterium Macca]|nr:hypothetical protein [Pasteurellaceae bacterium Macca]MCK3656171.1 hypothetical protein [Pasteurellaceae bacterium Macca]
MKRDWDLIRRILFKLEAQAEAKCYLQDSDIVGFLPETVSYHYKLMKEAGLIEAIDYSGMNEVNFVATGLTWQGHELLDKIRHDNVWNNIKATVKNKSLDLSFEAIKTAISTLIKVSL